MTYGSLFSGIEAASLAFGALGWEPVWFSEIDKFCCNVLQTRWGHVNNLGDVNNPDFENLAKKVDLIIGGSPCPSFSLAGKRKGMKDERGLLTLRYCNLLEKMQPRWFIWENVPGVLTSNEGADFERVINEMVRIGYGVSWRVLDARCFGLPQSRKRLFVVGRFGAACPSEILFESSNNKNLTIERTKSKPFDSISDSGLDVIAIAMRGRRADSGEYVTVMEYMDHFGCLRAIGGLGMGFLWDGIGIRKVTPIECERLQGIPDNHTNIEGATDEKRWRAIGNSMAVPVIKWIGERIKENDSSYFGIS